MVSAVTARGSVLAMTLLCACRSAPRTVVESATQSGPSGTIVVSNMNDHTATLLDARTRRPLATLATGRGPHEVTVSHDGRWAVVSNYGTREQPGSSLTVIDIDAHTVSRTVDLGEYKRPHGLAFLPGDSVLAVTSEANRAVLLVDFHGGRVLRVIPSNGRATHMIALSASGNRMVAANIADGTITILEPLAAGDASRTVKVGRQPEGIAITPDGGHAWVGSNQDSLVLVVDLARGQAIDTLRGFGLPYRMAVTPNGRRAIVTDPVKATVRVFDAATRREAYSIPIPHDSLVATAEVAGSPSPEGVTISRDSRYAFVTLQGRNRFVTIDLDRGSIIGYGVTGNWSDGIGFSPRGG